MRSLLPAVQRPTVMFGLLVIVSVAGGVLLSSQWRLVPPRIVNPIQPFTSLTETREALAEEQSLLKEQILVSNEAIETRAVELARQNQIDSSLLARSEETLLAAALTAVKGPGIVATLNDSEKGDIDSQAIAHAADLRDIISLLRAVGAEALAINGERVTTTTAIDCIVNTILVNETRLANPYVVTAIGDATTMSSVLLDPSVLQDLHRRVAADGVIFTVTEEEAVTVPAFSGILPGTYAKVDL